jgi:ABC-2 type transport system permease protein
MHAFWSVFCYEFRMSIHRKGMWIAYGLIFILISSNIVAGSRLSTDPTISQASIWSEAAMLIFMFNLFAPVIGGITAADRLVRDRQLGVDELLRSTPLTRPTYLLGKYFGVLVSLLLPMLVYTLLVGIYGVTLGAPPIFIAMLLVCFFAMMVPAYAFVIAFSLACPLVIPLRIYQVLFTGYWYWGNYLNPAAFPSISDTLLVPCGKIPMGGLFGVAQNASFGTPNPPIYTFTRLDVLINYLLLLGFIVLALTVAERILARQARTA